jgi:long-chain acyl-CoA synthetase
LRRLDWQSMAHSCFAQNIPFCTAYDTLGPEGLQHSLAEPEVVGIFTNPQLLKTLCDVLDDTPTVRYVIYNGKPEEAQLETLRKKLEGREGAKVISLDELKADGRANKAEANPPKADDVACIMYTSGSTGKPKGVILKHSNLVAATGAVELLLGQHLRPTDTFLAYLPLAHILEFIVECSLMYVGVTMGYGGVKTLTPAGVKNCEGDLMAFKPSVMVGVPAVWETIRKGILTKVNAGPAVARLAFKGALSWKRNSIPLLSSASEVIFNKVRAQTGGRLRIALSGGAAISRETQEFLDMALVTLLQGYGMTESCGMCTIGTPDFCAYSTVGAPSPAIEIKLVDVPDAGYFATNDPPQGEVLIRGPAVTEGYFKREETTREAINADGWLMTGDVGQWNKDGTLSVIDRKKNLVKLSGGEYIAIEKVSVVCEIAAEGGGSRCDEAVDAEERCRPKERRGGGRRVGAAAQGPASLSSAATSTTVATSRRAEALLASQQQTDTSLAPHSSSRRTSRATWCRTCACTPTPTPASPWPSSFRARMRSRRSAAAVRSRSCATTTRWRTRC